MNIKSRNFGGASFPKQQTIEKHESRKFVFNFSFLTEDKKTILIVTAKLSISESG
jgi:hypothetical protein